MKHRRIDENDFTRLERKKNLTLEFNSFAVSRLFVEKFA